MVMYNNFKRMTWFRLFHIAIILLISLELSAQHGWTVDPTSYAYSGQIDAIVILSSAEVSSGTLGAFVNGECRGYTDGLYFTPTGKTIFSLICYSNSANQEELSFRYYNNQNSQVYEITEKVIFEADMTMGDALNPVEFNAVSNSLPVADCPDYSGIVEHPGTMVIDLCSIFSDADGDALVYSAVSDPVSAVTWSTACAVNFTPLENGTTTLELSASDAEGTASCYYEFTYRIDNKPPVIDQEISDQRLLNGFGTLNFDLSNVFSDPDGDPLTFTAQSSATGIVQTSISGSTLTLAEGIPGNAVVKVSATDGVFTVSTEFRVILVANGPTPPWNVNPGDFAYSGQVTAVVEVNSTELTSGYLGAFVGTECRGMVEGIYFPPGNRTIFNLLCYSNNTSGEMLTFKYYHPNDNIVYNLEEYYEFTADMALGNALAPIVFHFTSSDSPPGVVKAIDDIVVNEHFSTQSILLTDVFDDSDGDELHFYSTCSDISVVSATISGNNLVIGETGIGTATILVSASDGKLSIDDRFTIAVNEVNDAPVIKNPLGDMDQNEGFRSVAVGFAKVFSDPENDQLSYSAKSNDTGIATVYIDGTNLVIREVAIGTASIDLCASDGEYSVCDNFQLTIHEVNDPPDADCDIFKDTAMVEGFGSLQISGICDKFSDPEGLDLTLSVTSTVPGVATAAISGCNLIISEVGTGDTRIRVCASDGVGATCCSFNLNVAPENELLLFYKNELLDQTDSVMICSKATTFDIMVESSVEWSFVTYSEWIGYSIPDDSTLRISCPLNATGEWRLGLAKVVDVQGHQSIFYVHQSETCNPDGVFSTSTGDLQVYPNPVNSKLNIDFSRVVQMPESTNIKLYSATGRLIGEEDIVKEDGIHSIDMEKYHSGLYMVVISDRFGYNGSFKIVKN